MEKEKVEMHAETRKIYECVITPEHEQRVESPEFRKSKKRLKDDGHFECWVCKCQENLQVHHFAAEWSLAADVDFERLKLFCQEWDPYGYGKLLQDEPITTVDDIRNMLVLCQTHHTGVDHENNNSGTGIHSMSFSAFIIQKICKNDYNPVPQDGETIDEVIDDITERED